MLEQGQIAERGSHDDLLARDGIYAAMWNRQAVEAVAREQLEESASEETEEVSPEEGRAFSHA